MSLEKLIATIAVIVAEEAIKQCVSKDED